MESRIIRSLVIMVAAVAFSMAVALPAGAGPAVTNSATDFYTAALDADGNFKLVFCAKAHQVIKGDKVKENYSCEFVMGDPNNYGGTDPVLPDRAMHWDYESSMGLVDANLGIAGPYRWYSDIEAILTEDDCFMYTNDWRMVITPSGNVNVIVVYDPPVFEGICP